MAERELERELLAGAGGCIRKRVEQFESVPREHDRFAVSHDQGGALRSEGEILHCARDVPRCLEQKRQLRGDLGLALAVVLEQRLRHGATERGAPGRREAAVERVLIQHVDEAVPQRQSPVGELLLSDRPHEGMDTVQLVQPVLRFRRIPLEHPGHDRGVELVALHAGRHQQAAVVFAELTELPLDHAADRFGQVAPEVGNRSPQRPAALFLRQHLSDILSGMYSLGGQLDSALVQQRIHLHPAFEAISYTVDVYRGKIPAERNVFLGEIALEFVAFHHRLQRPSGRLVQGV